MLFAADIVFIDEMRDGLNNKLKLLRDTLESRGFRVCRSKIEYLKCGFSGMARGDGKVTMDGVAISRVVKT